MRETKGLGEGREKGGGAGVRCRIGEVGFPVICSRALSFDGYLTDIYIVGP